MGNELANFMELFNKDIIQELSFKGAPTNYVTRYGGGRGQRSVTLCDKGGRDPKFCDITFQK